MTQNDCFMVRATALVLLVAVPLPSAAGARTSLGTFERWGAFRDERPVRCFAIAEPVRRARGDWPAFAAIATWPGTGVRGQLHIRLPRVAQGGAPVRLTIGARQFALVGGGADAWAPDARADAAIAAAMRSALTMRVEARAVTGALLSQTYVLKGAATAMDAAALGCARG